ncbi:hypothetical protein Pmani_019626 [Petrolisthes manimaculis]|uniref:Uncharacterized protein n=1 Tax=Petrolisthes manimaculis TaxID=1843537 RepID=A0AAE1U7F5_9EUCA|nr:hypothetical protein Pmani_019626 [Petrolisthes manimaculis]
MLVESHDFEWTTGLPTTAAPLQPTTPRTRPTLHHVTYSPVLGTRCFGSERGIYRCVLNLKPSSSCASTRPSVA